jgi:hypothetical protein
MEKAQGQASSSSIISLPLNGPAVWAKSGDGVALSMHHHFIPGHVALLSFKLLHLTIEERKLMF